MGKVDIGLLPVFLVVFSYYLIDYDFIFMCIARFAM